MLTSITYRLVLVFTVNKLWFNSLDSDFSFEEYIGEINEHK